MDQGMDRIIRLGKIKFYLTGLQFGIILNGLVYQLITVVIIQKRFFGLKRTFGGNYKPYLVQIGEFYQMIGDYQMSDMNRVKGPKIKSDTLSHTKGFSEFHKKLFPKDRGPVLFLDLGSYKIGYKLMCLLQCGIQIVVLDDMVKLRCRCKFNGSLGNPHIDFVLGFRTPFF